MVTFVCVLVGVIFGLLLSRCLDVFVVAIRRFSLRALLSFITVISLLLGAAAAFRVW